MLDFRFNEAPFCFFFGFGVEGFGGGYDEFFVFDDIVTDDFGWMKVFSFRIIRKGGGEMRFNFHKFLFVVVEVVESKTPAATW